MTKGRSIVILIIIGIIVYFNSLFNGFVWDDEEQILNNITVHSLGNFTQFFKGSTFNSGGSATMGGLYYKPFMTLSFAFLYNIFGPLPFWFHLFQLILHISSAILLFFVFKYFFKNTLKIPLILAMIFLIHPINTETVVYISDLQDILFFFFGILAFWKILSAKGSDKEWLLIGLFLLSSLLSKETGILFLLIIIVYLSFYQKLKLKKYLFTSVIVLGIYSFLRFFVAGIYFNKHGLSPITTMSLTERLISIPQIIIFYLKTFFFPKDLAINQHWVIVNVNFLDFFLPLIITLFFFSLLGLVAVFIYFKSKSYFKTYLFFLTWFILGLGMHLQIFPLDLTVSDRWFYFPMIGLLGMIGILIEKNLKFFIRFPKLTLFLIVILVSTLSIRVMIRNFDWKNGLTLYSHDINISKNAFDLENNLGVELFRNGRIEEASLHFEKSIKIAPNWWTNWNNLGVILERKGDYSGAEAAYQKAIDNGNYYLSYENMANILFKKDSKLASEFTAKHIKFFPQNNKLWLIWILSEYKLGNIEKALTLAKQYYSTLPSGQSYYLLTRLSQGLSLDIN